MERLSPGQIAQFLKRFRFRKGLLRGIRLQNRSPREQVGVIGVTAFDTQRNGNVRLKLVISGVDEYRFQRRPNGGLLRLGEVRVGYFDGLIYLDLDAFAGEPAPQVMDFRASDAFIAGRDLSYEIQPPRPSKPGPAGG